MQMNGHLSEYDEKAITDVFLHEKNAGIIGGYCEDGFPLYYANDKMAKMLGYPDTDPRPIKRKEGRIEIR